MPKRRNPSVLKGSRRQRVFVGGSYLGAKRNQLGEIAKAVRDSGFIPVVADEYRLSTVDDIHTDTMALLHNCALAVFELSTLSGALMEIERLPDYATRGLVLYYQPNKTMYLPSRMLSTFIQDNASTISLRGYVDDVQVPHYVKFWLADMRTQGYE